MKKTITIMAILLTVATGAIAQPYWQKLRQSGDGLVFETMTASIPFRFAHNNTHIFMLASGYTYTSGDVKLLLRSADNGDTWTEATANNLDLSSVRDIYASSAGTLLTVRFDGVYRSVDNGANFSQSTLGTNINTNRSAAVHANGAWHLIVQENASPGPATWGLFKSTDDGLTFSRIGDGVPLTTVYDSNEPMAAVGDTIVVRNKYTTDNGATWDDVQGNPASHDLGIFVGYHNGSYYYVGKATASSTEFIKTASVVNPVWERVGTATHASNINRQFMASNGDIFIQSGSFLRVYTNGIWHNDINEGYVEEQYKYPYPTFAETPDGNIIARALITGDITGLYKYIGARGSGTTGISSAEHQDFDVQIYPNPAGDFVTIAHLPDGSNLSISDITGKVFFSTVVSDTQTTLNTANYKNGIYLMQIEKNGIVAREKLVVNR